MNLRKIRLSPTWLSKIRALKNAITSSKEFGPTPPRGSAHRKLRQQWAAVCLVVGLNLNIGMYFGLRWAYPSDEEMNLREEISTLLSIQGYLIAKNPKDITPSMDSIRDVVFGPKVYGSALRARCKEMLKVREKIDLDPVLANTVESSLERWEVAERELRDQRRIFIAGFLIVSLGAPLLLYLLALPAFAKAVTKVKERVARKNDERARIRRERTAQATAALNAQRTSAALSKRQSDHTEQ